MRNAETVLGIIREPDIHAGRPTRTRPMRTQALESRMLGNVARPVRRGVDGKVPGNGQLASSLPYPEPWPGGCSALAKVRSCGCAGCSNALARAAGTTRHCWRSIRCWGRRRWGRRMASSSSMAVTSRSGGRIRPGWRCNGAARWASRRTARRGSSWVTPAARGTRSWIVGCACAPRGLRRPPSRPATGAAARAHVPPGGPPAARRAPAAALRSSGGAGPHRLLPAPQSGRLLQPALPHSKDARLPKPLPFSRCRVHVAGCFSCRRSGARVPDFATTVPFPQASRGNKRTVFSDTILAGVLARVGPAQE